MWKFTQANHRCLLGQQEAGYETLILYLPLWRLMTLAENKHTVIHMCVRACVWVWVCVWVCVCMCACVRVFVLVWLTDWLRVGETDSWVGNWLWCTVFTRVIHALFLTKILYLNLGCVIYARKQFYINKSGYTGNFLNIVLKPWITRWRELRE